MTSGWYTTEDYETWKAEEHRLSGIISELHEEFTKIEKAAGIEVGGIISDIAPRIALAKAGVTP